VLDIHNKNSIKSDFALLLETACEQYEVAEALVMRKLDITAAQESNYSGIVGRANSTVIMALAKEFLFNARRAYRLLDQGKGELDIDRIARKKFMETLKVIINVRDVNEHGRDKLGNNGRPAPRESLHEHLEGQIAVSETAMVVMNGDIFIGPLRLVEIYKQVAEMRAVAGFSSLSKG
jgi:hypothetical protein